MSAFIFNFIQSMRMREKAYFKRYAQLQSDNPNKNYLRLYDAIESQPSYSKEQLLDTFKNERLSKHLSSEIHYLSEQLFNSLINFHFETSNYRKLIKFILQIDLLTERGFRKKAQKILNKAKKLAYHFEEFSIILKLIQLEEELLFKHGILNFTQKLHQLKEEREHITKKIQNLNELRLLREQTRELQFSEGFIRKPKNYPHIFENDLLNNQEQALSLNALENWHYIQCLRKYLLLDFKSAKTANIYYLQFFLDHEQFFRKEKILPVLSNLLYFSALDQDQNAFDQALTQLESLEADKDLDQPYIKYIKYARLLELFYQLDDHKATSQLLKETDPFIKAHHNELGSTERDYLTRMIIRAHLHIRKLDEIQDWINFWYKVKESNHALYLIKLLSLIVYCEMEYKALLEAELSSSTKLLRKLKQLGPLENRMLSFFKKWIKISPQNLQERIALLDELQIDLDALRYREVQQMPFIFFNFGKWCAHKKALLKEKQQK